MLRTAARLATVACLAPPGLSQLPPQLSWVDILEPSSAAVEDFGYHLAVDEDGDRLAVAARSAGGYSGSTWSVFVFERFPAGWVEIQQLVSPVAGTELPSSLALHGDRLVVGEEVAGAGLLFVYGANRSGTWSLEAQLDPQILTSYGPAVATTGDTLFAGGGGAVHVFVEDLAQPSGWREEPLLPTPAGAIGFGRVLDAVGDRLIVGSYDAAHVFDRDPLATPGWSEVAYLGPYVGPYGLSSLAGEVAIFGDTAVVGDPNILSGDGQVDYGAAYVHVEDAGGPGAWGLTQKIYSIGLSNGFGETVDVGPNRLVAMDKGGTKVGGQAQLFERVALPGPDAWKRVGRLSTNQLGQYTEVRLAGKEVLVGSVDDFLFPTGWVQVFELKDANVFPGFSTVP